MLVVLIVLTPLSVVWKWPDVVSGALLFVVIGLLLLTGQTIIFLLRLVAADRRGRRRPLGSATQDGRGAGGRGRDGGAAAGRGTRRPADEDRRRSAARSSWADRYGRYRPRIVAESDVTVSG